MSTIQNNQASWTSLAGQQLDPKYEKCRNITEEIYKRINITFQIKKLENGDQSDISDNSDQIDSNELSNETDLFACDKSDISSSTEAERRAAPPPAFLNNNNNEERGKTTVYKRPRKRFRKRVKKRSARARSASEGSSDEAPLSRSVLILPAEIKPKSPEQKYVIKKSSRNNLTLRELLKPDDIKVPTVIIEKIKSIDNEAVKRVETTDKIEKTSVKNVAITTAIETSAVEKDVSKDKSGKVANKDTEVSINKSGTAVEKVADVSIDKRKAMSTFEERRKYNKDVKVTDWKSCTLCSLSFRGERGLRRHMSMSHIGSPGDK